MHVVPLSCLGFVHSKEHADAQKKGREGARKARPNALCRSQNKIVPKVAQKMTSEEVDGDEGVRSTRSRGTAGSKGCQKRGTYMYIPDADTTTEECAIHPTEGMEEIRSGIVLWQADDDNTKEGIVGGPLHANQSEQARSPGEKYTN